MFCAMTSGGSSHPSQRRRSRIPPLLERIVRGAVDPGFVVSHRWSLSRAPEASPMFNDKMEDGTKVVLDPAA
jgi:threonine dehydrogenase-like Zn-dependent dehydrogenase